jgi:hypothetical protein
MGGRTARATATATGNRIGSPTATVMANQTARATAMATGNRTARAVGTAMADRIARATAATGPIHPVGPARSTRSSKHPSTAASR